MKYICFLCALVNVINVILGDEAKIISYFKSDTFKTIQKYWEIERKSFENALQMILSQNYGHGGMNVYVRKMPDSYKISDGFFFSDNIVDLVLLETRLMESPNLISPDVTFALAYNYLHIEARLGKIILNSDYLLIRNQSDIVFTGLEQDAYKTSPFSFHHVKDTGELTIIAQDCNLIGYTITTFSGNTVNLGLDTFKVTNCKFSIEIYSVGVGSPPVFASYFSTEQSLALEMMLSIPMSAELMPKLQAAVISYVNTSAIFDDKLPKLRHQQNLIFKETSKYMKKIVGSFVKNTIKNTEGILQMKSVEISWNKTCLPGSCGSLVRLNNVILYGLDTAYSAHIGGPFRLKSKIIVAETIRFSTMQVRGKIYFENTTVNGEFEFGVELRDIALNVEMEGKANSFVLNPKSIGVIGWRIIEFSILELDRHAFERRASQSFITGYLINEIPKCLTVHISKNLEIVNDDNEHDSEKTNSEKSDEESFSKELDKTKGKNKHNNNTGEKVDSEQNANSDSVKDTVSDREKSSDQDGTDSGQSFSHPTDNEVK